MQWTGPERILCFASRSWAARSTALRYADEVSGMRDFALPDGTQFCCWTSGANVAGRPCYIWSDCRSEIFFRLILNGKATDWKSMRKYEVFGGNTQDNPAKVVPHSKGTPGAIETLPAGRYKVEFKVGDAVFTGVKLTVRDAPEAA
jgi:hypothetical protein